jgi:predicted amidophosphoribosyltransferase
MVVSLVRCGEPSSSCSRALSQPVSASLSQKGGKGFMTHVCCPDCRLRFTPAAAAYLSACPKCGEPLQPLVGLAEAVGYRLFRPEDVPTAMPEAIAVSLPIPTLE